MRTLLILLSGILTICFSSCNLNELPVYSPDMGYLCTSSNLKDTLYSYYTNDPGTHRLDTISEGDTILIGMRLTGLTSNLTSFSISQSDTAVAKILLPSETALDTIFSKNQSDYQKLRFTFLPGNNYCYFPFRYIARKTSLNNYLIFTLSSDAKFKKNPETNTISFKLQIPIATKKVSKASERLKK